MKTKQIRIGDHLIRLYDRTSRLDTDKELQSFRFEPDGRGEPDMVLALEDGYGSSFRDYDVESAAEGGVLLYRRADYLIETDRAYRRAVIAVHDGLALRHALMNYYSAHIVRYRWGLLLHASCAVDGDGAHLFAGQSGAGKSTAARLSRPRPILADEAAIIKLGPGEATVCDSPFRSELGISFETERAKLASIQLLIQSAQNERVPLGKSQAVHRLVDKVFYWRHDPDGAADVVKLLGLLVDSIPVYDLYFERKNTFWELIRT